MGLVRIIRSKFQIHPDLDALYLHQTQTRIDSHSKTVATKPAFLDLIHDIQTEILHRIEHQQLAENYLILELGSGVLPLSRRNRRTFSSDLELSEGSHIRLDGTQLGIRDKSFDVIYGQNVFHHFTMPSLFLQEAHRILRPQGRVFLVEPSFSFLAKLIYPNLFKSETYVHDLKLSSIDDVQKHDAYPNQASSYVLFFKNQTLLLNTCPYIESITINHMPSGLRYLLSGGINFRSVVPSFVLALLRRTERTTIGRAVFRKLSLHWIIELKFR